MASRAGVQGQAVDRGLVDRLTGAVRGAIKGASEAWFGPLQPITPVAPEQVRGRRFDYPSAVNTVILPRGEQGEQGVSFAQLRALADPAYSGLDLLRLAIETRKDQMAAQKWAIRARDETDGGKRARAIEATLRRPDGVRSFLRWQRMLDEDALVIDAPTLYMAPGGQQGWRIPQVMDGALIKPLVGVDGRPPPPPEPCYQQTIKGFSAVHYTSDEIVYAPRNERSHRIYGMSPVEQVCGIISIALRRQLSQLEYYTAGSVPDLVFGVPETWSPANVAEMQTWWDSIMSGNTEERRRARFVPGGVKPFMLKEGQLKDEFDEWLARIICYCFSLSPQALVKETNRATAETAKQAAAEEGLEPLKLSRKDMMDEVLAKAFDADDLEFTYRDEEITDPETKAKVISLGTGGRPWWTQDEARAKYGEAPLTPKQREELAPAPEPQLGEENGAEEETTEKVAQAGDVSKAAGTARRSLRPISRDRDELNLHRELVAAAVREYLGKQRAAAAAAARDGKDPTASVDDVKTRTALVGALHPLLAAIGVEGVRAAAEQVRHAQRAVAKAAGDDFAALLDQASQAAVDFARERAAELVGMKWVKRGRTWVLAENPNAEWRIDDATRDAIRVLVTQAEDEGWSNDDLAGRISEDAAFSDSRAEMVARTETAMADLAGVRAGWKESGVVVGRRWRATPEACEDCQSMDGEEVGLDEEFDGGDIPRHPRCECQELAVLSAEE